MSTPPLVLNAQTEGLGSQAGEHFSIARVRREVLGRSYIGAIATDRQGGRARNTLVGAAARFTLFNYPNVMGLAARADDRGRPGQWATQLGAEWRDDCFEHCANYVDIDRIEIVPFDSHERIVRPFRIGLGVSLRPGK